MSELDKTRSCVFCDRIAANKYDGMWQGIAWFEPLNPVTPGHMLFVPQQHRENAGVDPLVAGNTFSAASRYAYSVGVAYNLITSAGEDATQSVWHLHVHYVPRRPDDGLMLPWTNQVRS